MSRPRPAKLACLYSRGFPAVIPFPPVNPKKRIAVIPGDGIGKEVIPQAVKAIEASCAPVELSYFDWGADRYLADGVTVPPDGFAMLTRDFDAILAGAFGDPRVPSNVHAKEILLGMRFQMDLYANVRPVKLLDAALCPLKNVQPEDVNFTVIRENTEGLYCDVGGTLKQGTEDEVAVQEDVNTRKGVERIIRYAFDFANRSGRKSVCMSDKNNVMRFGGDLWLRTFEEVAREYPGVEHFHLFVDALAMQMVRAPEMFEVIVTNNMFGDIVTDLGAALQGGLGMAASGNIHPGPVPRFEPIHGSAPKYVKQDVANPIGAILTAAMMLDYLGYAHEGKAIEAAVVAAVDANETTKDLGGSLGTKAAGEAVLKRI